MLCQISLRETCLQICRWKNHSRRLVISLYDIVRVRFIVQSRNLSEEVFFSGQEVYFEHSKKEQFCPSSKHMRMHRANLK